MSFLAAQLQMAAASHNVWVRLLCYSTGCR